MGTRTRVLAAALAVATLTATTPEPAVSKTVCGLYCDAMTLACEATFGVWKPQTCEKFHEGCLDGCDVLKK